jgi:hypothetical protein
VEEKTASGLPAGAGKNEVQSDFPDNGAVLRLVPEGRAVLPATGHRTVSRQVLLRPFEIEAAPVTNHQYTEFLNRQLSTLTIARGVVRDEDEIWLMLGEIFGGYEPIIFRGGSFHLKDAAFAAHPVLRVTPYGAAAYAAHYGRRLPNMAEWYRAVGVEPVDPGDAAPVTNPTDMSAMHEMMMGNGRTTEDEAQDPSRKWPQSVSSLRRNKFDIRVMPRGFGEWALLSVGKKPIENFTQANFAIMPEGVKRQAWEAFEEVGFRCVKPVENAPATD